MSETPILEIPYPDEGQEEFFSAFVSMMRELERITLMNKIQNSLFLGGGGTISFSTTTNILQWTEDFILPIPQYGKKITISYGPDHATRQATMSDGSMLVIELPYTMNADRTANFDQISQVDRMNHQRCVLAIRIGDRVYFKGRSSVG